MIRMRGVDYIDRLTEDVIKALLAKVQRLETELADARKAVPGDTLCHSVEQPMHETTSKDAQRD